MISLWHDPIGFNSLINFGVGGQVNGNPISQISQSQILFLQLLQYYCPSPQYMCPQCLKNHYGAYTGCLSWQNIRTGFYALHPTMSSDIHFENVEYQPCPV